MNIFDILKSCISQINLLRDTCDKDSESYKAFTESISVLDNKIIELEELEKSKLLKADEKFDSFHNDFETILKRGHIGIPGDYQKYLSHFTTCEMNATEVFNNISEDHKSMILCDLTKDKNMIEQMVAYRHDFKFITHSKGHDGINEDNSVYEVKNHQYKKSDTTFSPSLKFDRLSPNNLRKLTEGRPTIILNVTDKHKLVLEMKMEFTDELIKTYEEKMNSIKYKDTSGCSIAFNDYSHAITDLTFVCEDIENYNLSQTMIQLFNNKFGTDIKFKRKSTLDPKIQKLLDTQLNVIRDLHSNGTAMAKIARDLSKKDVKLSASHIKKVLKG